MRPHSLDLRQRVLAAHHAHDGTLRRNTQRFGVSRSSVRDLARRHRDTGSVRPEPHAGGRRRAIDREHEYALLALYHEDSDAISREFRARLAERYGVYASLASLDRAFTRSGVTRKKSASTPANET